ncbi:MAG: hypothetical protein ACLQVF_20170 [Isosphaeraceae bacterium]
MTVEIVPGTYLIRVALESIDPDAPAAIVNAVVRSYLRQSDKFKQLNIATQRRNLQKSREDLDAAIEELWEEKSLDRLKARTGEFRLSKTGEASPIDKAALAAREKRDELLEATFLQHELTSLLDMRDRIDKEFRQMDYEDRHAPYRMLLLESAEYPKMPSNDRHRIMVIGSVVLAAPFVTVGIFLLLEIKAKRRASAT